MSQIVSGPATSYDLLLSAPDPREPLKSKERSDVAFNYNEIVLYFTSIYSLFHTKLVPHLLLFRSNQTQSKVRQ